MENLSKQDIIDFGNWCRVCVCGEQVTESDFKQWEHVYLKPKERARVYTKKVLNEHGIDLGCSFDLWFDSFYSKNQY